MKAILPILLFVVYLLSCNSVTKSKVPKRHKNIPSTAFWVGGMDGGNWYLIKNIDTSKNTAEFSIYNDFTGELILDKSLKLNCDSYKLKDAENLQLAISFFDGKKVFLTEIRDKKYCFFE